MQASISANNSESFVYMGFCYRLSGLMPTHTPLNTAKSEFFTYFLSIVQYAFHKSVSTASKAKFKHIAKIKFDNVTWIQKWNPCL